MGEVYKGKGHQCGNWLTSCFLLFQDLYPDCLVPLNSGKKSRQSVLMSEDLDVSVASHTECETHLIAS